MKALVKTKAGDGNVELIDLPEPGCASKDVKIEVRFTGICGTDLHVYHDTFRNYPPVILGHEFSGIVFEVGGEVKRIKPGDRVAVLGSTMVQCGTCEYCMQGQYMFCPDRRGMGHGVNGSFTRYVSVREDMVYRLPESVSLEVGALVEPLACAVQAVEELTAANVGDVVFVSGPGPIGLLCVALLAQHGCRLIVAGTEDDGIRLEVAKRLGADVTVNVSSEDVQALLAQETHGRGADLVVECSGSPRSVANCLVGVRKLGKYIQVGLSGRQEMNLNFDTIVYKQLQMFGSLGHALKTWDRSLRILAQGKIDFSPVISHKLPLARWKDGFSFCAEKQGVKVLLYYE